MSGKYLGMPAVLAVIALVLLALPSHAEGVRVRIPDGCRELANRAGLHLWRLRPLTFLPCLRYDGAVLPARGARL